MKRPRTRRAVVLLLGAAALLLQPHPPAFAQPPAVRAHAAVLMDIETGSVLYQKQMHQSRPVASTTKIMTALLALENCKLDDSVVVTPADTKVQGSSLYLKPGDLMRVDDLLAALLLKSANDAALAIAAHISGGVPAFADLMNHRASQLGTTHTNFVNPHGLHHPDHYSSAHDLALITREALKHPRFRELVSTRKAQILVPSDPGGVRTLRNHNKLLRTTADFVDGVKTGYVKESGHCLVASATKDDWQLVAVILDSREAYRDALRLLDYGFPNFRKKVYATPGAALGRAQVRGGAQPSVPAICHETLVAVTSTDLPRPPRLEVTLDGPLQAPISRNDPVGRVRLLAGGEVLAHAPLLAGQAVPRSAFRVIAVWALRALVILAIIALLVRHYAKAVKTRRGRRLRLPP
ncbi:MAG: D-alanyl-D-alanine carboxypeptidase [Armatimonadota bacterium]|nr:MAG: D-alanyl-D-alanine carboxypeptidase [Armatimonadota bacterium]